MPKTNASPPGGEPVAQRGRPAGDHAAKRAEILKAAASVIAEDGYAKASLRKVAERAGYTTGAVTYYFANKEELVTALAESRFDRYDAMLEPARAKADIKLLYEQWLAMTTGDPEYWPVMSQLLTHARYEPALASIIEQRYARYHRLHTKILEAGQAQGTIRDDIPADLLADQLAAMGDGWMMMFPFEPERFDPSRVEALIDAVLTLIAPIPGTSGS
ncbi:TetR/AcrR family transcriptional regulator [Saccharopolyspora oryzae]|uniref:TetR/AcrR family transcriptional regulator n=1 Tax=Saccharopolyspora oryzae TaxID=2997343 RepID=A0ABT4V5W7_9PSEU|nr:TetR/AcrR family transcriptional regulator [Saccharopolyspora oryzae]MDA3628794.1 TetR/AcrR family transcriptional regulator [Saccharopolyspora oryzae]